MMNIRKYNSFTLLEMLVVILIIGIFSGLVVPGFYTRYQKQKFQNYCYKFMNFLKNAHNKTVVEGRVIEVEIKPHTLIVAVPSQEDNKEIIAEYPIPEEYKLDTQIDNIYFYPTGEFKIICDGNMREEGSITLSSRYGENKISLWAGSGTIFLEE